MKKEAWKKYLNVRSAESYNIYKERRKIVEKLVLEAEKNEMNSKKKRRIIAKTQMLFYKILKTQRRRNSLDTI